MNILYISEMLPLDTYASEVVFYRHFKRLADEGHNVHIVTDQNSYLRRKKDLDNRFIVHLLPNRKWFYPPYRSIGFSQMIRFTDYFYNHVKKIVGNYQISNLVGFIYGDFLAPFCAHVQSQTGLPLVSFFHDDTIELQNHKSSYLMRHNTKKILNASNKVLIASEAFKDNWPCYSQKFELLYPIPEEVVLLKKPHPSIYKISSIGYSGSLYNEIIPYIDRLSSVLEKMEISLNLIGNNDNANYLSAKYKNVTYRELFETAEESNRYLIECCDVCVIPYPEKIHEMPWIKTCFPSKLIQYCLLNMPTIIIAPTESALGKWCIENGWLLYTSKYDDSIADLIKKSWSKEVVLQIEHINKAFDPSKIHDVFMSSIIPNY